MDNLNQSSRPAVFHSRRELLKGVEVWHKNGWGWWLMAPTTRIVDHV